MDGTAVISTHKDIVLGTGDFGFQVWGLGIGDWDCRPSLGPSDASVLKQYSVQHLEIGRLGLRWCNGIAGAEWDQKVAKPLEIASLVDTR